MARTRRKPKKDKWQLKREAEDRARRNYNRALARLEKQTSTLLAALAFEGIYASVVGTDAAQALADALRSIHKAQHARK